MTPFPHPPIFKPQSSWAAWFMQLLLPPRRVLLLLPMNTKYTKLEKALAFAAMVFFLVACYAVWTVHHLSHQCTIINLP